MPSSRTPDLHPTPRRRRARSAAVASALLLLAAGLFVVGVAKPAAAQEGQAVPPLTTGLPDCVEVRSHVFGPDNNITILNNCSHDIHYRLTVRHEGRVVMDMGCIVLPPRMGDATTISFYAAHISSC